MIQLPNAEALVIENLLSMPEVTSSALGRRIYSVVPKSRRTFPLARVSRFGGDPMWSGDPYWIDQPMLQVDCWADGGMVEAEGLAELLRAACKTMTGSWPRGVIGRVTVTALIQGADPTFDPPKPRYRFTTQMIVHPSRESLDSRNNRQEIPA